MEPPETALGTKRSPPGVLTLAINALDCQKADFVRQPLHILIRIIHAGVASDYVVAFTLIDYDREMALLAALRE
jgi:hypothetical protein